MSPKQPWKPADATLTINQVASDPKCTVPLTGHARDQMLARGLIMSDVLFVLRNGFVYEDPVESTVAGLFKYRVESRSPNSGRRTVRVVAVPEPVSCQIKIITVMWRDEK
jgi:hypothetical protein